jgi:hypothetical protein
MTLKLRLGNAGGQAPACRGRRKSEPGNRQGQFPNMVIHDYAGRAGFFGSGSNPLKKTPLPEGGAGGGCEHPLFPPSRRGRGIFGSTDLTHHRFFKCLNRRFTQVSQMPQMIFPSHLPTICEICVICVYLRFRQYPATSFHPVNPGSDRNCSGRFFFNLMK